MPQDLPTTIGVALLTLAAVAASVLAVRQLLHPREGDSTRRQQDLLLWLCALGSAGLFAYRAAFVNRGWTPLEAHIDGLLLLAALFACSVLFLRRPSRLPGMAPFALPLLALILAWAICASVWTFHGFDIHTVWRGVHIALAYVGALFVAIAAMGGGMFLFTQYRLRHKLAAAQPPAPMANLESLERLIIRTSALGFACLSVSIAMGLIEATTQGTRMGPGWWHSPKVVLAALLWVLYGVLMNVRHATHFRGARAAWLSIIGLALLLAVFGISTSVGRGGGPSEQGAVDFQLPIADCRLPIGGRWLEIGNRKSEVGNPPELR